MTSLAVPEPVLSTHQDDRIRNYVQLLMNNVERPHRHDERREDRRVAYPYPIYVTPVDDEGNPEKNATFAVLGKHLAERGLDFYHRQPLTHRRVIASFECGNGRWISLTLTLNWCRFNSHGWYDTGGRFLQVVPSPLTEAQSA